MQRLAEGRLAEIYDYGEGRVVKLDRPGWEGVAVMEAGVIARMADAGLPVARCEGVVSVDGRPGLVLERIEGGSLDDALVHASPDEVPALAAHFVDLHEALVNSVVDGLDDLLERLANEISVSGLATGLQEELTASLHELDDGRRGVCHYDFLPGNVLLGSQRWVVIDWLTVANGPPAADLMRTLVCAGRETRVQHLAFYAEVRRLGLSRHQVDDEKAAAWARPLAAARLAEGFGEEDAAWLRAVAEGRVTLPG